MNVKELLKSKGISLSKFADDFRLSRNTVTLYISKYESGEQIPKEKYAIVFDQLFNEKYADEFQYNYLSMKYLIERDDFNGILDWSPEKTDVIMSIFKKLLSKMENDAIDKSMLFFIDACILNSSNEYIFKTLSDYFYFFNNSNESDYEKLTNEQKNIYTNYFKVFTMQKQNLLSVDKNIEEMFLARIKEMNALKKLSTK